MSKTRWRSASALLGATAILVVLPMAAAIAQSDASAASAAGNTAWLITATALVLFMTLPGLALFYGGLVKARNVISVLMHCFAIACVVSILWAIVGYSLAFADGGALLGPLDRLFLAGLGGKAIPSGVPENVFFLFQLTFAIITPALIIGAFPERVSFPFVLMFSGLWLLVVYGPVAHWLWGGGWAASLGAVDFAGGIVVHTTAGVSALVAARLIGGRLGFPQQLTPPHNPGMAMTGAAMLWIGWFGFNGGSALTADAAAGSAILATHLAASAGALSWMTIEWARFGKPSSIGLVTGMVAGLATITPAAGVTGPMGAIALGAAAGGLCFTATRYIKTRAKIDDSLDVFAVHGVGGTLGSLSLAATALPALGGSGLAEGMTFTGQLGVQALSVAVVVAWSALATAAIVAVCRVVTGVRVSEEQETIGLDLSAHGERGYEL